MSSPEEDPFMTFERLMQRAEQRGAEREREKILATIDETFTEVWRDGGWVAYGTIHTALAAARRKLKQKLQEPKS